MKEKLSSFFEFLGNASQSRTTALLVILVIAAAVPLTVLVAQRQQNFQQKADSSYCLAQTNPNFCTAANGCQWSESASIPPGQFYGGGASSGGCIPLSGGAPTTAPVNNPPATTQTTFSCQGTQLCTTTNGVQQCGACSNGLSCVTVSGTPTCTGAPLNGGSTTTPPSTSTGTQPSCTITPDIRTINSGGTVTLSITTQNTGNLGNCRLVDQNNATQDPTTLDPFSNPPKWKLSPTSSTSYSLQCPINVNLCNSGPITVVSSNGTGTGTGTTTPPTTGTGTTTTTGTPSSCSQQYFGCNITSSSCLDSAKTGANCLGNWTNFFVCTGNSQSSAVTQAQSVCAAGSGASTFLRADVNHDRSVDTLDYNILISCMTGFASYNSTTCGSFAGNADLNKDGVVDQLDYNAWLRLYRGIDAN